MLFNPVHDDQILISARGAEYTKLDDDFHDAYVARRTAAEAVVQARQSRDTTGEASAVQSFLARDQRVVDVRARASDLVRDVTGDDAYTDINYVFPTFVTTQLPIGLVGLMIAAIFAAAMSSIAAELNSLSTATVIDFYRRHYKKDASDQHYLWVSKVSTGFWGVFASVTALFATNLGSLIEVVNRFGSFFYGSLLGVFALAVGVHFATAAGAFWGLVGGMITVATVAGTTSISFLWLNLVGAAAVIIVGVLISRASVSRST